MQPTKKAKRASNSQLPRRSSSQAVLKEIKAGAADQSYVASASLTATSGLQAGNDEEEKEEEEVWEEEWEEEVAADSTDRGKFKVGPKASDSMASEQRQQQCVALYDKAARSFVFRMVSGYLLLYRNSLKMCKMQSQFISLRRIIVLFAFSYQRSDLYHSTLAFSILFIVAKPSLQHQSLVSSLSTFSIPSSHPSATL